jgi:opine dehydrogenase
MTTVAILGGGAGGCSAAVDLTLSGHRVHLWSRSPTTLGELLAGGDLAYAGVLGSGKTQPAVVTTHLADALDGADVAVICLPALAHDGVLTELADLGVELPLVLNPGHTGGALHARVIFARQSRVLPPIAELSTLTYVARKSAAEQVSVYGKAGRVHAAALPGGDRAMQHAMDLFPASRPAADVLASSLANVNLVLHPPGAVLGAAWVEATGGQFTFYVDGMTDGVVRVIRRLDEERLQVARAFGHELPPLLEEMTAIGTVDASSSNGDLRAAIRGAAANSQILAPDSLAHRYYREDLPFGVVPFLALAAIAEVPVPAARALLTVAEIATGEPFGATGLTAERLGLSGIDAVGLREIVTG